MREQCKILLKDAIFLSVAVAMLFAVVSVPTFAQNGEPVAATYSVDTNGFAIASEAAKPAKKMAASSGKTRSIPQQKSGYTTNEDTDTLQKAVDRWNQEKCPPQNPIREITDGALSTLVKYELIKRADLDKYANVVLVNGKVYEKEKTDPDPEPRPPTSKERVLRGGGSLMSVLNALANIPRSDQAKAGRGNPKFDPKVNIKPMRINVRDEQGRVVRRKVFVPVLPQHKVAKSKGETFPDVPDVIRDTIAPAKVRRQPIERKSVIVDDIGSSKPSQPGQSGAAPQY